MSGSITCPEVLYNIRRCVHWKQLYHLIYLNPIKYDVHLCLTHCHKSIICGELIFFLLLKGYLIRDEVSFHYDYYENIYNPYDFRTNRTFFDYIRYLGGIALLENDMEAYDRYADAWNAPIDLTLYKQRQDRNENLR